MVGRENSNLMKNYKHLKSVSGHGWKLQPPLETFSREGLGTPPVSRNQSLETNESLVASRNGFYGWLDAHRRF